MRGIVTAASHFNTAEVNRRQMTFLCTPLIFLVHIAEEWWCFPAWASRHFGTTSRAWYVYSHIVLIAGTIGICWIATISPTRTWTIWAVAVQWGLFTNAVFHVATTWFFREYSPGLVSSVLCFVPITIWQLDAVSLDGSGRIVAAVLGSTMGGFAVASLWLHMNIDWSFRRVEPAPSF
jgi:hypothetical protein